MTQRPAIDVLQVLIVHLSPLTTQVIWYLLYHFVAVVRKDLRRTLMVVTAILLVMAFTKILKES